MHTSTAEGMRRAIAAGDDTIEHGYGGTAAVRKAAMTSCPTLTVAGAVARHAGWNGGEPAPGGAIVLAK